MGVDLANWMISRVRLNERGTWHVRRESRPSGHLAFYLFLFYLKIAFHFVYNLAYRTFPFFLTIIIRILVVLKKSYLIRDW